MTMHRAALLALALALAPALAAAQAGTCTLQNQTGPFTIVGTPGNRVIQASGPILVTCAAGEELRADSAVVYEAAHEVHLFRRVDYQDPTRTLTSDQAIYNSVTGRLYATGNVVFTDRQRGSTLRGPELEYFRAMEGRPESQSIATGRPHLTVVSKPGDDGKRRDPMEIDGDRITSIGNRVMSAEGNVVIESGDLDATSNLATYEENREYLELRGNARVRNPRYDLTGDFVSADMEEGKLSQVLSRDRAKMVSERLTVTGPEVRLYFANDSLQRMVAAPGNAPRPAAAPAADKPAPSDSAPAAQPPAPTPPVAVVRDSAAVAGDSAAAAGDSARQAEPAPALPPELRSVALSKGFRLEADSLEALLPGQELREVHAVGAARGEAWDTVPPPIVSATVEPDSAAGDSARPAVPPPPRAFDPLVPPTDVAERDLLLADTIIGYFRPDTVPAAPGDTTRSAELERMVAIGHARSVYRLRDEDAPPDQKRAINYLVGRRVDLTFAEGEVDVATVLGLERGIYLDPVKPGQQPADSAAADSAAAGRPPPPPGQPAPPRPQESRPPVGTAAVPASRPRPGGQP